MVIGDNVNDSKLEMETSERPAKRLKRVITDVTGSARWEPNTEHTWEDVHKDLENNSQIGTYGSSHAAWHALAGLRAGINLQDFHSKRSPDEFYIEELDRHLKKSSTRKFWNKLVSIDPLGMYAQNPTMSATTAKMTIPEIVSDLTIDNKVVNPDRSINVTKLAVDYVWNLPGIAKRCSMNEVDLRNELYVYTQNDKLKNNKIKTYLPPLGGCTVYFFGSIEKLSLDSTEVSVRVHDACGGSDVFGTDICTCRPYLTFSIRCCVDTAQRGGVGIIVYFQKEGRSLGEVTKFRVYNARKRQAGGDRPEKYFYQTEQIAGIRDARFQELMPDVLLWLGISRIDWLMSMSSDKYDAICGAGIRVMQRVELPDMYVPKGATVEITAKIASGYHTDSIASDEIIANLRSLEVIRTRCNLVYECAKADKTLHFALNLDKMPDAVDYVMKISQKNYPHGNIPYHSRWRHLNENEMEQLYQSWPCSQKEKIRRCIDLITVSVLLDAGAGTSWKYMTQEGKPLNRSEGIAQAVQEMFLDGIFSSDISVPHRVNSHGLRSMTVKKFSKGFQHSEKNPLVGLNDRFLLMQRFANALEAHPEFFGKEICRPGNIVDYIMKNQKNNRVSIKVLWKAVIEGLESVWPENMSGVRRGDVWSHSQLKVIGKPGSDLIPFHKLSQWLTYSLLEPFERYGIQFDDLQLMTGLAEYRNGGLFVDTGVLTLKDPRTKGCSHDPGSELIVEWRALTIILLDKVANSIRSRMNKTLEELPLAKVLQGGTWAAGRALAQEKRPTDCSSPIKIRSDGTVF